MRVIVWISALLAALWSGYWFVGARALRAATDTWLTARAAEGWRVETGQIDILGFPNRFDTTVQDVTVYDPRSGLGWTGDFFQVLALSYQPNHAILVFPERHSFTVGGAAISVQSAKMQSSVVFGMAADAPLDRSALVTEALTLKGGDWTLRADALRFATERSATVDTQVHVGLAVDALTPPVALKRQIDPDNTLPNALSVTRVDAELDFDRTWNRFALGSQRPRITQIDLTELRADWGEVGLRLSGTLDVGQSGQLNGALTLTIRNWRLALELLENTGSVPADRLPLIARAVQTVATLSGSGADVSLPVSLSNGTLSVAMLPIGTVPSLPPYRQ